MYIYIYIVVFMNKIYIYCWCYLHFGGCSYIFAGAPFLWKLGAPVLPNKLISSPDK